MDPSEYERIHQHETSHFWYRGVHALFRGALARALRPAANGREPRLLDAGCGTGGLLASLGRTGVGLDLSPLALRFAAGRGLQRLVRASVAALPFADASFDAVVSADVLYHSAVPDDAAALREMARVVRPGAVVLLNLPAHPWLRGAHDAVIHTARRYSRADVHRIAAAAGLEVERLCWFNAALLPVALLVRWLSRDRPARSDVRLPPAPLNTLLSVWMKLEAAWTLRLPLPWGLSLFAILRKPGGPMDPSN